MRLVWFRGHCTENEVFHFKDFFSKCDQIRSFLRIWTNLLKKSLMKNFIFCAVGEQLPSSLAIKSGNQKRKKADGCKGLVEDEYDVKNIEIIKIMESVVTEYEKLRKKAIFFLLAKMIRLIPIHIEIKPTVGVMFGSIFQILWIYR